MKTPKILRVFLNLGVLILGLLVMACFNPLVERPQRLDTMTASGEAMLVSVSFPAAYLPGSTARGLTIAEVQITARSADGFQERTLTLAWDADWQAYRGTLYLEIGHWLLSASAKDSAGVLLFSGQSELNGQIPSAIRLNLLREVGGLDITAEGFDTGSFETLEISASRATFPTVTASTAVEPSATSTRLYLLNLSAGSWNLLIQGKTGGIVYYEHSYTVTVQTDTITPRTLPIFIQRVSPVRFSPENGAIPAGQSSINVTMSSPTNGASIRYTLDGSEPTQSYGLTYYPGVTTISVSDTRTIRAIAWRADGSALAAPITSKVYGSKLAVPSSLTVTGNTESLVLGWTAVPEATGYQVWYGESAELAEAAQYGSLHASTTVTLTGLEPGTLYHVWVRAVDASGTHAFSPAGSASTLAPRVIFEANDGAGSMADQYITSGDTTALSAIGFSREGYSFAGWAQNPTGAVTHADGADLTMGDSNITLYARWTPTIQTIRFDQNHPDATGTMADQTLGTGMTANLRSNDFVRTGYVMVGWALIPAGVVICADQELYTIGAVDVTLYAVWKMARTISFDANGGTGMMEPQILGEGQSGNLTANAFTRTGYVFDGWSTSAGGTVGYTDQALYSMGTADVTLFAVWVPFIVTGQSPSSGVFVDSATPILSWADTPSAVAYEVRIAVTEMALAELSQVQNLTVTNSSYQLTDSLNQGDVRWWSVRAVNSRGERGIWTEPISFVFLVFSIGDSGLAGGVVFYDKGSYSNGWRYLEAWPVDQSGTYLWKTSNTWTRGTSTAIGSGYANTYTALAGTIHPAAEEARNATHGGYSDWFLPSKDELNQMYIQRSVIGGFGYDDNWSSSEIDSSSAWGQRFFSGYQPGNGKAYNGRVRVVRAF